MSCFAPDVNDKRRRSVKSRTMRACDLLTLCSTPDTKVLVFSFGWYSWALSTSAYSPVNHSICQYLVTRRLIVGLRSRKAAESRRSCACRMIEIATQVRLGQYTAQSKIINELVQPVCHTFRPAIYLVFLRCSGIVIQQPRSLGENPKKTLKQRF